MSIRSGDQRSSRRAAQPRTALGRRRGVAFAAALLPALVLGPASASPHVKAADSTAPHTALAWGPPPVRLFTDSVRLVLHPYTSCWTAGSPGGCYDGFAPSPRPSLGGTVGGIRLAFARDHWGFQITVADRHGHSTRVPMVRTGPRSWRLAVGGLRDGHYTADLFGSGPQGDVLAAFAFTLKAQWWR